MQAPFQKLMELTDSQLGKFCPDVGQLTHGDFNVVETIQRYADRIVYIHFKDVTFAGRPQGEL